MTDTDDTAAESDGDTSRTADAGQFGVARWLTAVAGSLPSVPVAGGSFLLVGSALFVAGLFTVDGLALLGAVLALPGIVLLTLGYSRGSLDVGS